MAMPFLMMNEWNRDSSGYGMAAKLSLLAALHRRLLAGFAFGRPAFFFHLVACHD
jgi:hypothetical protein